MQIQTIPLAYNQLYLVESDGVRILIDAGPDYAGAWDELQAKLGGVRPDLVIATHGHLDHAGLGARWRREGVPVAIGAADHEMAAAPLLPMDDDIERFMAYAREAGTPPGLLDDLAAGLRERHHRAQQSRNEGYQPAARNGHWPTELRYDRFEPDRLLDCDGPLAGTPLEVLRCPGHTPGNLVLFAPTTGELFSGDQLLPDLTPTPSIQFTASGERIRSLPLFVAALRRVRALAADHCFPGHGQPFATPNRSIDASLAEIEARAEKLRTLREQHGIGSVYELAHRAYPRALRRRYWQIMATVQGHLDLLSP